MGKAHEHEIKDILEKLLGRLHVPYYQSPFDHSLYKSCIGAAKDRGISLDGGVHFGPFIPLGVTLASTSYAHLPRLEARIYIALYTAALVSVEDVCFNDFELLKAFCHRFMKGTSHGHPILDCFDQLLRELPDHYDLVVADMMLQSNLDFIVGLVLEYEMQQKPMSSDARGFPVFLRNLSGVAKMYSMLVYPREIPLMAYVEALPASITYVNFINDIFSFYKEELDNESFNCISNIALCNGWTKLQTLKNIADESVEAQNEVFAVLSRYPNALEAYKSFDKGYVYFHTSTPRYKIAHIWSFEQKRVITPAYVPNLIFSLKSWRSTFAKSLVIFIVIAMAMIKMLLQFIEYPVWFPSS